MTAALDLVDNEEIDAAILDVHLDGEFVFPAEELERRDTPFVFATAFDRSVIPAKFASFILCEKPTELEKIAQACSVRGSPGPTSSLAVEDLRQMMTGSVDPALDCSDWNAASVRSGFVTHSLNEHQVDDGSVIVRQGRQCDLQLVPAHLPDLRRRPRSPTGGIFDRTDLFSFRYSKFAAEGITHDGEQPRAQPGATPEIAGMGDSFGERFLNKIINIARRIVEASGESSQAGRLSSSSTSVKPGPSLVSIGVLLC
ncbi:hypothetical protein [Rhizobium redzepovicii]